MWKNKLGFTLVELLMVIGVIGVLSASTIVISVSTNIKRGNDNKRKADLESIRSALEIYKSDSGTYPCNGADLRAALVPDYILDIPSDPKTGTYFYNYGGRPGPCPDLSMDRYCLQAFMEIASNATPIYPLNCAFGCGASLCNYSVYQP